MSNSEIEQSGTVKGHLPNEASLSGRISNGLSLSGHISIGSGAGDFIIKMTIEVNGNNYTVTSCDKTMEQIDAAVASGQNIKAIAFDKYVMPMTQMEYSESYTFEAFLGSFLVAANVYKNPESGTDDWEFYLSPITADIVEYSNASMPRISTVSEALDALVPNSHTHSNKSVLDKFAETDGKPTYNGEALGGGAGDFIIKMTVEFEGSELIVTSCDTTVEQIDEAVVAEKRVVVVASVDGTILELPMVQGNKGNSYYFCAILSESVFLSSVYKIENTSDWSFGMIPIRDITAEDVSYHDSFELGFENVGQTLDALVTGVNETRKDVLRLNKSEHTHSNKAVLDKFAETDGKPTYEGAALGSDFIINMTVTSDDNGKYTVTSCDTTVEQIDSAVAEEKRVVLIATDTDNNLSWDIPIVQGFNGSNYYFATFLLGQAILSFVQKISENEARWQFMVGQIGAEFIGYSNDALPNMSTVQEALDKLVPNYHTHSNKAVLDKFAETDGKPTYNGEALGSGAGDFIINMTVEGHDEGYYTVTSCDATIEQIDAAVAAEKRVILIATDTTSGAFLELPIVEAYQGATYIFIAFTYSGYMMATVYKSGENEIWEFVNGGISAESVSYYNSAQQDVETVMAALNKLFDKSHTHANKDTLDKLSVSNGKLQYNGSDVGLKPVKGTDYWTEVDKQEIVNDTLAALPTWTGGNY